MKSYEVEVGMSNYYVIKADKINWDEDKIVFYRNNIEVAVFKEWTVWREKEDEARKT